MAAPFDLSQARDAEALERALSGAGGDVPAHIAGLLGTARQVATLPVPGPDPAFVASLGARLQAEAGAAAPHGTAGNLPSNVIPIRRTLPKAVAGTAAGLVAASAVLGVATQHVLPGNPFYGVRGVVDGLESSLAGSDQARGRVELDQARDHITDAETLVGADQPNADDIITSLDDAAATVSSGEDALFTAFDTTHDTSNLQSVRDFTVWAGPRVENLRTKVPAGAAANLDALTAVVKRGETRLNAALASCGAQCSAVAPIAPSDGASATPTTSPTQSPSSGSTTPSTIPTVPAAPTPAPSGPRPPLAVPTAPFTTRAPLGTPAPSPTFGPVAPAPAPVFPPAPLPPVVSTTVPAPQPPATTPPATTTTTTTPPAPPTSTSTPPPVPPTRPTSKPPTTGPSTTTAPTTSTTTPSTTPTTRSTTPTDHKCPPGHVWDGHDCSTKTDQPAPEPPSTGQSLTPDPATSTAAPTDTPTATLTPTPTTTPTPTPTPTPTRTTDPAAALRCAAIRLFVAGLDATQRYSLTWAQGDGGWYATITLPATSPLTQPVTWTAGPVTDSCKASIG